MVRAYIDESQPGGTGSGAPYYLAATILLDLDRENECRLEMAATRPGHLKKQRWSDADAETRREVIGRIATFPTMHVVAVNRSTEGKKDERARRECLETLLYHLDLLDVTTAVLECRTDTQDRRDRSMLDALRSKKTVARAFRIGHMRGAEEPLLWIPDAIAGVVSSSGPRRLHRREHDPYPHRLPIDDAKAGPHSPQGHRLHFQTPPRWADDHI